MSIIQGEVDLTGYHVWWVVTDSQLVPFQGPYAKRNAENYASGIVYA